MERGAAGDDEACGATYAARGVVEPPYAAPTPGRIPFAARRHSSRLLAGSMALQASSKIEGVCAATVPAANAAKSTVAPSPDRRRDHRGPKDAMSMARLGVLTAMAVCSAPETEPPTLLETSFHKGRSLPSPSMRDLKYAPRAHRPSLHICRSSSGSRDRLGSRIPSRKVRNWGCRHSQSRW